MKSFLHISGQIRDNKYKEFEQTFGLGFSTLSKGCISNSLSVDINNEGFYHFFSIWKNDGALKIFLESADFQLLSGAFHALGTVSQTDIGEIS